MQKKQNIFRRPSLILPALWSKQVQKKQSLCRKPVFIWIFWIVLIWLVVLTILKKKMTVNGKDYPIYYGQNKKTVWNHQPVVDSIWKSHVAVNPPWFLITEQCWHQRWAFTGDVDAQKLKAIFQFAEPKGKPQLVGGWYRYTSWKLWKSMGRIIRFNPYYIYIRKIRSPCFFEFGAPFFFGCFLSSLLKFW